MHFKIISLCLLVQGLDALSVARALSGELVGASAMEFTGPIVVGGPVVTLSGDAKSIYEQVLKLNPNYNALDFPEYREKLAQQAPHAVFKETTDLQKRDGGFCTVGNPICGPGRCDEGTGYLYRLNGYCGAPPGPAQCARVSCSNHCGIFLCNDNNFPINVWCGNIAGDAQDIISHCTYTANDGATCARGQVFRSAAPGWNTVISNQNC